MNNILHLSLEQIAKITILLNPIIPIATTKVLDSLNIDKKSRNLLFLNGEKLLKNKVTIKNLSILFKKIVKWL